MNNPAAWLEISVCADRERAIVIQESLLRQVPVLSEVLLAAQGASAQRGRAGVWEYCRKLGEQELQDVKKEIVFGSVFEDDRSVVQSVNISHDDTYYTLRLFVEKNAAPT